MAKTEQKQWPKTTPKAFYLGESEDKARRLANLAETARLLNVRGASTVVQMIADMPPEKLAALLKLMKT